MLVFLWLTCLQKMGHFKRNVLQPFFFSGSARGSIFSVPKVSWILQQFGKTSSWINAVRKKKVKQNKWDTLPQTNIDIFRHWKPWWQRETLTFPFGKGWFSRRNCWFWGGVNDPNSQGVGFKRRGINTYHWKSHFLDLDPGWKVSRLTSTSLVVCLNWRRGFPFKLLIHHFGGWLGKTWTNLVLWKFPWTWQLYQFRLWIFEKFWVSPRISKKSEVEGEKVFFPGVLPKHGVWPFKVIEIYYLVGGFLYGFSPNLKNTMHKSKLDHVPRSKQKYLFEKDATTTGPRRNSLKSFT